MKKLVLLLITLFLLVLLITQFYSSEDIITPVNMRSCDLSSKISKKLFKDDQGKLFNVYWSDKASDKCPGKNFPRIVVEHPKVQYWVQLIKSNIPYSYLDGHTDGWMGNIDTKDGDTFWLDIPKARRVEKNPYYTSVPQKVFHDNPHWGFLPKGSQIDQMVWRAFLYGYEDSNINDKPLILSLIHI